MWRCAERAIELCRDELAADPSSAAALRDLREHELQLARLELYFRRRAVEEIRDKLQFLLEEWERPDVTDPGAPRAIVAAKRNLAECLFEFEPLSKDPANRKTAERLLVEAVKICDEHGLERAACDVVYSRAKLSETGGDAGAALGQLNDCMSRAARSRYFLVYRIADARRLWTQVRLMGVEFNEGEFQAIQRALEFFDWHVWAARFAMQTRLWAAKRFAKGGDAERAVSLLARNRDEYLRRPALVARSDRVKYWRTCAGLAVLDQAMIGARAWDEFKRESWAADFGEAEPQIVWEEVD
jgi:hypothetical protein